jgi:alpha-glucosidase
MKLLPWEVSVHHDGSPLYLRFSGRLGDMAVFRLRMAADAPVHGVFLRTCPDGEQQITPLQDKGIRGVSRWWEGTLPIRMLRTNYRFLIRADDGTRWYSAGGMTRYYPTDANDFVVLANYHAPAWVRDTVFYQIFPDRFADGDPTNNVQSGAYLYHGHPVIARRWHEQPNHETGPFEFYGGDLQGIAQRLDYLTDLGISALYLNPIFRAPSNHKYYVEDYTSIDPHLGGETGLLMLRQALDDHQMRLVLDIVPNHCGVTHPWFVAAQRDPHAPTSEFFIFRRHPHEYESWLGVKTLPKLNYRSVRLREIMYAGHDAIMRHWLRPPYRIDGWRIDVANMLGRLGPDNLGHKIGRGIRRAVKAEQPDAYLLGEHFFDGTPHLQGEELDATMNYQGFTFPIWRWLGGFEFNPQRPEADPRPIATETVADQWTAFRAAIPWQIASQQFNLLGSHDTPRIRTIVGNDLARVRVAMTLLFCYPGVPCIYYGDEIGLTGSGDPDCRRPMPWDESAWDHDLRTFVQQLVRLRRSAPALRWGGFQQLYAYGETIAFQREAPEQRLIIVARRSDDGQRTLPIRHAGLADGTRMREILTGTEAVVFDGRLDISSLPATGAQVWQEVHRDTAR